MPSVLKTARTATSGDHGPITDQYEKWPITKLVAGRSFVIRHRPRARSDPPKASDFPGPGAGPQGHARLSVPLLREGESVGLIAIPAHDVHPFSGKQIACLHPSPIRP